MITRPGEPVNVNSWISYQFSSFQFSFNRSACNQIPEGLALMILYQVTGVFSEGQLFRFKPAEKNSCYP